MKAVVVRAVGIFSLVGAAYIGMPSNDVEMKTLDLNGLASLQNAKNYAFIASGDNSFKSVGTLDMWKTGTLLDMWKTDTLLDMWKTDTLLDMWKTDTLLSTDSNLL